MLVHGTSFVIFALFTREPCNDAVKCDNEIGWVLNDVVVASLAFDDVRDVFEVEISLPSLTMVLVVVRESCTLNEGVRVLVGSNIRVGLLQMCEHGIGSAERVGRVLRKEVLGNVGHDHVSVD